MLKTTSTFLLRNLLRPCIKMPGESYVGPRPNLTTEQELLKGRLYSHVNVLAHEIGERHAGRYIALRAACRYIQNHFEHNGYKVNRHLHTVSNLSMFNIEAARTSKDKAGPIILLGAHYDTVPGSPGANDNASAVAVLLELASWFSNKRLPVTLRFVAFCNEEHVNLPASTMGSFAYAKNCWQNGDHIIAMLAFETMGFYSDEAGSQHYPSPFNLLYPDTANFVGFIGNWQSRQLIRQCTGSFRAHAQFPCHGLAAPSFVRDAGRSDHFFFPRFGYKALMVTDTANFRYKPYHTKDDTIDKLDFNGLALVVDGLKGVITDIANSGI